MINKYKATIKYNTKSNHPDDKTGTKYSFSDTYTIDTDCFYSIESIKGYISRDLKLVAGGGYNTDTIENVLIDIKQV